MNSHASRYTPDLLRFADVQKRVGMGRSWLFSAIKAGTFPRPIKCGRSILFVSDHVDDWIRARITERRLPIQNRSKRP